jgi:hypothetical protein
MSENLGSGPSSVKERQKPVSYEGEHSILCGPWNLQFKSSPNQIKYLNFPSSLQFRLHFISNHFVSDRPPRLRRVGKRGGGGGSAGANLDSPA